MSKYLITGATGLIGNALVRTLSQDDNVIICPVRNIIKAQFLFANIPSKKLKLIDCDIIEYLRNLDCQYDYIIHCASPTASKYFIEHPVETLNFGIESTQALLEYSRFYEIKGMVYLSSLESYGIVLDDHLAIDENFQGYVNPLDVRSSYNMMKRTCECLCHSYCSEYDVPVKIARLTQTISPNITDSDMRVFAQFARKAANCEDIELHTEGSAARQYLYIEDAVSAIMTILKKGVSGEAYNVADKETYISVKELAQFVINNFNPEGKVVLNIKGNMGYAPTTRLKLDTHKLENLGWVPRTHLYGMFEALINNLK